MPKHRIAVVFGSDSDWPVMEKCVAQLRAFGEEPHVEVMSAHRNPDRVAEFAEDAEKNGFHVLIAAAGMSNALAGAVAAHTPLPVIGIPLEGGSLNGLDALLSTVQMPPGIPPDPANPHRRPARSPAPGTGRVARSRRGRGGSSQGT